ncbi:MAG: NAD(P)-binding domain-containing protein [Paludibacteraceae bacterium]|nr:NAD(P)-binding domain-containing protein [Paludibacteraceae bacterium]
MQIVSTTHLPPAGFRRLHEHTLCMPDEPYYTEAELCDGRLRDTEVLIATFDYRVTREIIHAAPHLRLIANFGAGYNNIDLDACRERGIRVTNTPQPVIEPTAELAFALMLDVTRLTPLRDRQLRAGQAEPFGVMNNLSRSVYGKTLGIIGMGRIGQALARRAVACGMHILYHNRHRLSPETEQLYGAEYVSLEHLLEAADIVSLNLPFSPSTHHLIGAAELARMKQTAYLVNTARGAHVDEQALVQALRDKRIAGAALDVYEHEPHIAEELLRMDNVVLSPHTGTGTMEGRIAMCECVCDNILYFATNQSTKMNIVL